MSDLGKMLPLKVTLLTVPIGHPGDITERVLTALKTGVYFLVEDTRSFFDLLEKYNIDPKAKRFESWHDQSRESTKLIHFAKRAQAEDRPLYYCSEAGSPVLSDPAQHLLKSLQAHFGIDGVEIKCLSGISAVTAALELSGLPAIPFYFWGFLGRKEKDRQEAAQFVLQLPGTHEFFMSPHRLVEEIDVLAALLPEQQFVLVREMTKPYESIYRFSGREWLQVKSEVVVKGEFVLLIAQRREQMQLSPWQAKIENYLNDDEKSIKKLSKLFAEMTALDAKTIYQKLVSNFSE